MQSPSNGEVLTCFYQKNNCIKASSYNIDIVNKKLVLIYSLENPKEVDGAKIIRAKVSNSSTKSFVCFINNNNDYECLIYNIITNTWENQKTYINGCIPKSSSLFLDYYTISNEYILYCFKTPTKLNLIKLNDDFEITYEKDDIDFSEILQAKCTQYYISTLAYALSKILALSYCNNTIQFFNYEQFNGATSIPENANTQYFSTNLKTTSIENLGTSSLSLVSTNNNKTSFLYPSLVSTTNPVSEHIQFFTTFINNNKLSNSYTSSSSIAEPFTTHIESKTSINSERSSVSSSSIYHQSFTTFKSSQLSSSLINHYPFTTFKSSQLSSSSINHHTFTTLILSQLSTNSDTSSSSLINQKFSTLIKSNTLINEDTSTSSAYSTNNKISFIHSSLVSTQNTEFQNEVSSSIIKESNSISNLEPLSSSINELNIIIQEKSNKTKTEIMDNIDEDMQNYDIGKIYEIFGEDYKIKISPINTNNFSNISTYINFSGCEKILRKANKLNASSILTVYQIEIDNKYKKV